MSSLQREYVLVTGNDDKWREADRILRATSPSGVSPILLVREKLDLPEIQASTTSEVAIEKARAAFDVLKRPVIIEDAGVELMALGGFPGPFIKFWEKLGGLESICRALDGFDTMRDAFAVCVLGVCTSEGAYVVEGRTPGRISERPRGTSGFGWDAIFIPRRTTDPDDPTSEEAKTFGEMTSDEKDSLSHRRRAWEQLATKLGAESP